VAFLAKESRHAGSNDGKELPVHSIFHRSALRIGVWRHAAWCSAALLVACSADTSDQSSRGAPSGMQAAMQQPQMPAGTSGDFGNAMPIASHAGGAGTAAPMPMQRSGCKGGEYVGKYNCDLDVLGIPSTLEGDVSFVLKIDETVVPGQCDDEFCPDLVIAEGSGTLFGVAGDTGWAFEAVLDGGLDCQTGEFRASAPHGIYGIAGSDDPNKPDALTTVLDPSLGEFNGTLSGMHESGPPERITGDWSLADAADFAHCTGPFMAELKP
jgi:hypothetical protein